MNISPKLVKSSLSSHSWMGLLVGGLMYIICLSGTLVVFYEEIERWEQPDVYESLEFDAQKLQDGFNAYINSGADITDHMYLVFPSEALPRAKVSGDFEGRYINEDGSLGPDATDDLSGLLTGLHINLHLPVNIGVIVVSAIGALLCALIITGFLSHPSIVKDAFKLRAGGKGRLGQVDMHNRLSVWGAPFHLMIAMTGAYYGLVLLVVAMFAFAMEGETVESITAKAYPPEPVLVNQSANYQIARAVDQVRELAPDGKLLYMIVHDAGSDSRFMEFYIQKPGLLAWSENYRFDTSGNYLDTAGYTEGPVMQQLLYSVYRIHFGNFSGLITKLCYMILGLSLTVVSATGINIWLEKRKYRDALNLIWPGVVWGTPLALAVASFTQVVLQLASAPIFWGVMVVTMTAGIFLGEELRYKRILQSLTAAALLILVMAYSLRFGAAAFSAAGLPISFVLLVIAGVLLAVALRGFRGGVTTGVPASG